MPSNKPIHVIAASLVGMMLEWYDFAIFAFLGPVISTVFFPHDNPHVSLLLTYTIYAIGYLIRPLSGVFFGHFGDRYGRRTVLLVTILMMAIPTALIGTLPSYAQVGILAPLLLLLLRIIQGISVGGESAGALILAFESAPEKLRGFVSTLTWMGTGVGILLASAMVALMSTLLTKHQLDTWGWRIPLFVGILTAIPGYLIRVKLTETPAFH